MDVSGRLRDLMQLPFAAIKELPEKSSLDVVDEDGNKWQLITWREHIGPDLYRVVVSLHRVRGLGFSSLHSARGFSISSGGTIEVLEPAEAEKLFS